MLPSDGICCYVKEFKYCASAFDILTNGIKLYLLLLNCFYMEKELCMAFYLALVSAIN